MTKMLPSIFGRLHRALSGRGLESLKNQNQEGKHLEHRQVGGAHPHMQRFWVSTSGAKGLREQADLHGKAAAAHRKLAADHGHGIKFEPKAGPKWGGGGDDIHQQKLDLEAKHPHLDFGRAHAHDKMAALHEAASNLASGIEYRQQMGHDSRVQERQLGMLHDHLDDWSYYARPRHEVDADERASQEGEDAGDQGRYRDYDDGAPTPRRRNPGTWDS